MSHPSLLWLRYWLPFLGCRRYAELWEIRHIIVLSFGRNTIKNQSQLLADIGTIARTSVHGESDTDRNRRLVQELRIGSARFPSINPGSANRAIAYVARNIAHAHPKAVLWVQWEVALALDEIFFEDHDVKVIWPQPRIGHTISTDDVILTSYSLIRDYYSVLDSSHTALIAHQGMIVRCMIEWCHYVGALPVIPMQYISLFDAKSEIPETRSMWSWWPKEMCRRWFTLPRKWITHGMR